MLSSFNADQVQSLIRSASKIGGAVLVTLGILSSGTVDALTSSIEQLAGAGFVLYGLFASFWHHSP
jgi:hypothetical protein